MAFCGNCGQKLLPNVKFCSNCGTPVPAEVQAMNTGDGQAAAATATATTPTAPVTPPPAAEIPLNTWESNKWDPKIDAMYQSHVQSAMAENVVADYSRPGDEKEVACGCEKVQYLFFNDGTFQRNHLNLSGKYAHCVGYQGTYKMGFGKIEIEILYDRNKNAILIPCSAFPGYAKEGSTKKTILVNGSTINFEGSKYVYTSEVKNPPANNAPVPANSTATSAAVATASTGTAAPIGKIQAGGKSFATIQAAIDGVAEGTEISIPAGNYNECIVVNKNVTLKGDGKNTIIHFKPSAYTDGSAVVKITSPCTIENLSIQEDTNQGGIKYPPIETDGEAALLLVYANAVLKNLSVKNAAIDGMHVVNASPTIENCEFAFTFGVVFSGDQSAPSVSGSLIHHNQKVGALFNEKCKGKFESCRFYENYIGVDVHKSQTQFYSCKFEDNTTHGVISAGDGSIPYFYDCDIHHNNRGDEGCAEVVIAKEANPFFERCGIYDNDAFGAFIVDGGMGMFSECDFKENDEDVSDDDEACKFVNCDFEGGTDYKNADSEEDEDEDYDED